MSDINRNNTWVELHRNHGNRWLWRQCPCIDTSLHPSSLRNELLS